VVVDTGSISTVIPRKLAERLGIEPVSTDALVGLTTLGTLGFKVKLRRSEQVRYISGQQA